MTRRRFDEIPGLPYELMLQYELSEDGLGLLKWIRAEDGTERFYHKVEKWIHETLMTKGE